MFNSLFLNNFVVSIHITQVKCKMSVFHTQVLQAFPLSLYKSFRKQDLAGFTEANYLVKSIL